MYTPKAFAVDELQECIQFVRKESFGILFAPVGGKPFATHLPMLLSEDGGTLLGHIATANPQWRHLDGAEVLAVFHGPHSYISPTWYEQPVDAPTWNYIAVHVYGRCRIVADLEELHAILRETLRFYEPESPLLADERLLRRMAEGATGYVVEVSSIEGKAKGSQNKTIATRLSVIEHLRRSSHARARATADWMERLLPQEYRNG
jgi:transcriptional regulator